MTFTQMLVETIVGLVIRLTPLACLLLFLSLPPLHFMAALVMFVLVGEGDAQ